MAQSEKSAETPPPTKQSEDEPSPYDTHVLGSALALIKPFSRAGNEHTPINSNLI